MSELLWGLVIIVPIVLIFGLIRTLIVVLISRKRNLHESTYEEVNQSALEEARTDHGTFNSFMFKP